MLLEALARVNEIGTRINRLSRGDQAGVEATLHLIAESATQLLANSAAAIYSYDSERDALDPVSRAEAGGQFAAAPGSGPRPGGLGMRAIHQRRAVISYDENDLEIHPARRAAGVRVAVCLPLLAADQPVGLLYVYLFEERRLSQLELLLLHNLVNQAAMAVHYAGQGRDLARKVDELSRLRHAGLLISSRSGLRETLEAILEMALEVTGARYGIFRLVDRQGQSLITQAIAGDHLGRPAVEALPVNTTSVMGWVAKTRQPLNIADVTAPPWSRIYYPLDHALQMRSELAVPLIGAGGRLEGVLNLESPQAGAFDEEDSHLLQALATQAVIAIQEARLLDALREMAERLLAQPAQQVLDRLVELACDLLGAGASAIWTLDGDELVLCAASEASQASAGAARRNSLPLHDTLTGQAVLTGSSVTSDDVRTDPRFGFPDLARAQGWTRALIVPLRASEDTTPLGAFSVFGTEADASAFSASAWAEKVLTILGHHAALALQNAAHQETLRKAQEARAVAETFAALGDVAANLLHHLNNKVGTIPVRIEGIQDKCGPVVAANPYLAANLAEIERSALEAMTAVRERLSLVRPIQPAPVMVAACVQEALETAHLPSEIATSTENLQGLPPVMASRESLTWVVLNLLENAAHAMSKAGQIIIRGQAEEGWVEVSVSDNGPGIDPQVQQRIFEFSYSSRQGENTEPARDAGSRLGFGLWWVRTLITRLGGGVTVESDGCHGATFRLTLPTAEGQA